MPEDLISVAEASADTGLSIYVLRRAIHSGALPAFQAYQGLRAPFLLRRGDVEQFVARRTRKSRMTPPGGTARGHSGTRISSTAPTERVSR
jgi:hypothetical protein